MTSTEWGKSLSVAHRRAVNKARSGGLWLGAAVGVGTTLLSFVGIHWLVVIL